MILFGSEYVGPAKYFSLLSKFLIDDVVCLSNTITRDILLENNLKCINNLDSILNTPDLVIIGRCFGNCLDKKLHDWGSNKGIKVVSIIDHWSWFLEGYKLDDGTFNFPDFIFVNDYFAYNDCIKEGIPPDRIVIAGNPVLEALVKNDNKVLLSRSKMKNKLSLPDKRIIVFISEELGGDFNGTINDLGYDEFKVLHKIQMLISPSDHLVIKMHPSEKVDKYDSDKSDSITVVNHIDIHVLNLVSDVIIGMGSMLLLELAMLRDDVISFCPNANKKFIGERLGATVSVDNDHELSDILLNPRKVSGDFRRKFIGSGSHIANIIREIQK